MIKQCPGHRRLATQETNEPGHLYGKKIIWAVITHDDPTLCDTDPDVKGWERMDEVDTSDMGEGIEIRDEQDNLCYNEN